MTQLLAPHPWKASPRHRSVGKRRAPAVVPDIDQDAAAQVGASSERDSPGAARAGYGPALSAGFNATASRVQEMHLAISGKTFDNLVRVPGLSVPTRIVQGVHDAIAQGVYAAVRHGGGAAISLSAGAHVALDDPKRPVGGKERAFRSALNAAVGDSLMASGNALAVQMSLHRGGRELELTPQHLAALQPLGFVFIHGLACDEQSWAMRADAWKHSQWAHTLAPGVAIQYGSLLEYELDASSIYLRYNTGLSIDNNARQLAALLERLSEAAPQVRSWALIGHSMGGLVARRAYELATSQEAGWSTRVAMIICLGSPHQGAPLEKLAALTTAALGASKLTRPLARIADARSRGVKDLRQGLKGKITPRSTAALRLLFATLGDELDAVMGPLIGKMFGDGLVMAGSAADHGASGDIERAELAGLGHMGLLNDPRVYAVIRNWLDRASLG
jgi:pimeloyl-ACP methyl ester carboxylesterase